MTEFANISSIILFAISIITFVSGLITKAQNDGKVLERIEQIQRDLEEIKSTLREKNKDIETQKVITESQEVRIRALQESQEKLDKRITILESRG